MAVKIRRSPSLAPSPGHNASPKIRRSPSIGHNASPVDQRDLLRTTLMRQISTDLSQTQISSKSSGGLSPARPPLGRIDSPNTTEAAYDEEIVLHNSRSLKRFRSFGSSSNLATKSSLLGPRGIVTPSPAAIRRRATTSPAVFGDSEQPSEVALFAWGSPPAALTSSSPRLLARPPPIQRPISIQSLDDWDAVATAVDPLNPVAADGSVSETVGTLPSPIEAPPPFEFEAWRPPPILRPCSVEPCGGGGSGVHRLAGLTPPPIARPGSLSLIEEAASSDASMDENSPALWRPSAPPPSSRRWTAFGARPPVPAMSLVAPNIYIGDEHAAASLAALRDAGVTHVLNCTHLRSSLDGVEGAPQHLQLHLLDNTSDLPRMAAALTKGVDFITSALDKGGTVLVHCRAGISRSATLVIAYLVRATQQPVDAVFERVRAKRRVIDPNLGYMVALQEWERRVLRSGGSAPTSLRGTPPIGQLGLPSPRTVRPLSRVG